MLAYFGCFSHFSSFSRKKIAATAIASALLAGCGNSPIDYRTGAGIGADLYSTDMAQATQQLNQYMGFLCQQAHFASYSPEKAKTCLNNVAATGNWGAIVHTGFNDIDRRCDDYLAWMEQARLRRDFGVSQLNALGNLTNAILLATTPSSAKAIGIVGLAFGYSQKLFTDIHTLINLGIENSTIKSIVSERRNKFRKEFSNTAITFKPNAVFTLRSYLRICMPFTITMDVNTFARATVNGTSTQALKRDSASEIKASLAGQQVIGSGQGGTEFQFGADDEITINPPIEESISGATTDWEKQLQPEDLATIQQYLCIASPAANFGNKTRAGFRFWTGVNDGTANARDVLHSRDGSKLLEVAKLNGACPTSRYKNFFERDSFEADAELEKLFVQRLTGNTDGSGFTKLSEIRQLVTAQNTNNATLIPGIEADEVTLTLFNKVLR
ncbi:MAG: hypothetical protein ABJN98_20070 [Roseibium sp.]|uniref:hypothetical protein n=1 Tax=Roseibium polysiphoniae TaxID=2571221 RepID=UPI0032969112